GGQISLYNLAKRLDRNVFEPLVLCPVPGPLPDFLSEEGIPVKFFSFPPLRIHNLSSILAAIFRFRKMALRDKCALVHTDTPRDTFLSAVALMFSNVKVIWHARVSTRDPVYDQVNKRLVSKIIGVSNAVSGRFLPCDPNKCVTIYNGVDLAMFSRMPRSGDFRREIGIDSDHLLVSTVMQVIPNKGAEEFVRAAVKICQERENVSFVVVGLWTKEPFIRNLRRISADFRERIRFAGYRKDIWAVLNDTDIFVLPSWDRWEGCPRVVIEAMACGVAVVGTDVEGINETVAKDQTGLLAPQKDVASLAKAIMKLIDDPKLRTKFGENGRQRAERVFDIQKHVDKIESLYQELLEKGPCL
ncbi:glycosyltransferase family 4 protein, partial [Acidobacteria bacterium AH-259-L09]|nr:glycosyltransferase family 4 protein [Acidobacteria bacterium AH-259-L09]